MIKEIQPNDTTLEIKDEKDVIVSNSSEFKAPEEKEDEENNGDKEEINLSDYATDYLQSILDWRKEVQ